MSDNKRRPPQLNFSQRNRADSEDSVATNNKAPSLKSPRTPRFAEATAVHSPIEPRTNHYMPQPQIADLGFGYVNNKHESVEMPESDKEDYYGPKSPLKSPLKSAMKIPGAPPREKDGILSPTFKESMIKSPTFREEEILEKQETSTDARQAQDLVCTSMFHVQQLMTDDCLPESEDASTHCQVFPSRCQLLLFSHHSRYAGHLISDLPRY